MTCKDCIHSGLCYKENDYDNFPDRCGSFIPERPQGEWIIHPHSMIMKCSLCGHEENAKDVGIINPDKHFCSNCGADMRGKEE